MSSRRTGEPWRLLVFADAGTQVGLGHLMRTRGLVEALRARRPVRVTYVGSFGERQRTWMRAWAYEWQTYRRGPGREPLRRLIRGAQPHIVIADAYRDLEMELRAGREAGACVVLFDDGQIRGKTPVSLRVTAVGAPARGRPADRHLTGPRYVCLRPEILMHRPGAPGKRGSACVVSLGGSGGRMRLGALVAKLHAATRLRRWVVVGDLPSRVRPTSVRSREISCGPALRVVTSPREASRAMATSTVAVSAAGTTAWELAYLGIPAVLWPMARNQNPIASALDGRTALVCRRRAELPRALARLLADRERMRRMAWRGRRLIDGKGAGRIASAIEAWMRSRSRTTHRRVRSARPRLTPARSHR